jgi:hypothetical protein
MRTKSPLKWAQLSGTDVNLNLASMVRQVLAISRVAPDFYQNSRQFCR